MPYFRNLSNPRSLKYFLVFSPVSFMVLALTFKIHDLSQVSFGKWWVKAWGFYFYKWLSYGSNSNCWSFSFLSPENCLEICIEINYSYMCGYISGFYIMLHWPVYNQGPQCLDYWSFIMCLGIRWCKSSNFELFNNIESSGQRTQCISPFL